MHLFRIVAAAIALSAGVQAVAVSSRDYVDTREESNAVVPKIDPNVDALTALRELQEAAIGNLENQEQLRRRSSGAAGQGECTLANARIRRDWEYLSRGDRLEYIEAVKCLRSLPAKFTEDFAAAARTRYDDFVAIHVNKTIYIHRNGLFLTYHRYLVWSYEEALRNECGYTGAHPYWNWFRYTDNEHNNPVFDGSDTSLGGDGEFYQHNGSLAGARLISLPSGQGGGCIKSGPFKNMTANIGPFAPGMQDFPGVDPNRTLHDYNPHCVRRDLNSFAASKWFTTENLLNVTIGVASRTHRSFWQEVPGRYHDGFLGFHTTGHYTVNGEQTDLYSSINDVSFFLHHAMFDQIYWIHQILHPTEACKVTGTMTLQNKPPSRNATIYDMLPMGFVGEDRPIYELFNTLGGTPLCYIYL